MMKKALSLLMCLIMVLSLAVPSVQAAESSSGNIMDGVYIDDASGANVVIDGNTVTSSGEDTKLPNPIELVTNPTTPSAPVVEYVCKCADLATAVKHVGVCDVIAPYLQICEKSDPQALFALWGSYTLEEQTFMLDYLYNNFPLKHMEFQKLLNAPTGSASETYTDGTTVSVQGIPQNGSVTVGKAADEVQDIVDAYVAENEKPSTELFSYDVSVQDGEGVDWQPETSVKMELDLPGQKLHKNTKVYVVHVDDEGNATTIEATVTEDGKIAFETPSFSAFYGFTVDFHYENITFSIPGESSIKLSELFRELNVPLNAEDVVALEYTDYTQIKIEQLEGDWLLTSLKAFDTEEKLTMTLSDGTVHSIKVTDTSGVLAECYFSKRTKTNREELIDAVSRGNDSDNGFVTLKLYGPYGIDGVNNSFAQGSDDGCPSTNDSGTRSYWKDQPVTFDGLNKKGAFDVCLTPAVASPVDGQADTDDYYLSIWNWNIINGAIVNVHLEGFDSNDRIIFRAQSYAGGYGDDSYEIEPMFTITDGSLYFNVTSDTVLPSRGFSKTTGTYKQIIFDDDDTAEANADTIIFVNKDADNLIVNDVKFQDSDYRAIFVQADKLSTLRLDNCFFGGSVISSDGGGGVIYIKETTGANGSGSWVNVDNLTLNNCTFESNTVGGTDFNGGAILIWGILENTKFYKCKFTSTVATGRGGAISIGKQENNSETLGNITFEECEFSSTKAGSSYGGAIAISQTSNKIHFKGCTFTKTSGSTYAGAIQIGGTKDTPIPFDLVKVEDCTFTECTSAKHFGGAIRICSGGDRAADVTIKGGTFSSCTAIVGDFSSGGAIGMDGTLYGNIEIDGVTFNNCQAKKLGGAVYIGTTNNSDKTRPTIGNVTIKNASFSNNTSNTESGGAVAFDCDKIGNITVQDSTFKGNSCKYYGGTIYVGSEKKDDPIEVGDVSFSGCVFEDSFATNVGGTIYLSDGVFKSISFQSSLFDNCSSTRYSGAIYMRTHFADRQFSVIGNISIIGCSFSNCHAGYLKSEDYITSGSTKVPATWDHDDDPDTDQIDILNGVGGGGAITIAGEIGGMVEIKGESADNPTTFVNCTSWNNGGAIVFPTASEGVPVPYFPVVELQYLNFNKCFARDAGFAMYIAKVIIPNFTMDHCTIENCGYFDLSDPNFPRDNVFPADGSNLDAKWFNLGDLEDASYLTKWQNQTEYPFDALCRSQDNGGTFRTIGNAHVVANITNCVFKNNKSYAGGAGVYWNSLELYQGKAPTLTITSCLFDGNYARSNGGGLYCESALTIKSCEFKNNVAGMYGGAIAQQVYNNDGRNLGADETNTIELGSVTPVAGAEKVPTKIHHNKAENGGGIAITVAKTDSVDPDKPSHYPIKFTLGGAHVYENVATLNGGGVYYATYTYDIKADQDEVDYFQKEIDLNDGLIWGNVAGASATQVEDNYNPQLGDQLIIAAVDSNMALGVDQDGNVGAEAPITKNATENVIFDNEALVLTLREGHVSGTFAFQISGDTYLAANKDSGTTKANYYQLGNMPASDPMNAWEITIDPSTGIATIEVQPNKYDDELRSVLRYNNNTGAQWFNIYTPEKAANPNCYDLAVYRVTSEMHSHGVASLVTDADSLRDGDRILIVAPEYNYTMKPAASGNTRAPVELDNPTQNDVTYTADTQVITLEDGATSGTIRMKVGTNSYLGGGDPSVTYSADTQVITLEDGATSGTIRMKVGNNSYLGGRSANAELDAVVSGGINEWRLEIDSNANALFDLNVTTDKTTNNETATDLRHILRLYVGAGSNAGKTWFNNYSTSSAASQHHISVYRVTSAENRKATLVTKTGDLKAGDKIIIVAREVGYNVALSTQDGNTDGYLRKPTTITKDNAELDAVGSDGVNEWFLEIGPNGKALFDLNVTTDKMINNVAATDLRHILRLYVGDSDSWFNNYSTSNADSHHDISVYRVTSEENRKATLVTRDSMLRAGDKFIIVAREEGYNVALSTQDGNTSGYLRKPTAITKYDNTMSFGATNSAVKTDYSNLTYSVNTQVFTLEKGSKTGTFALNAGGEKPYYAMSSTDAVMWASDKLDGSSSWTITIDPANSVATVKGNGTGSDNTILYNTAGWFNAYNLSTTTNKAIQIYKVTSEKLRTATLVTRTNDLKVTDKIIIVAKDYDATVSTTQMNSVPELAHVTRTKSAASNTQTLMVAEGLTSGTYALQTADGRYLTAKLDGLTLSDKLTADGSWSLSVSGGKLTATSNGENKYYLRYSAANQAFICFGNADTSNNSELMLYKLGEETTGGNGGGVYMNSNQYNTDDGGYSQVSISGGAIYGNVAYVGNGGGIYLTGDNAKCIIKGTDPTVGVRSSADQAGIPAIGNVNAQGVPYTGNKATGVKPEEGSMVGGNGGGIAINGGAVIEMTGGYVANNHAANMGGGIWLDGADAETSKNSITMDGGTIDSNFAVRYGGGVHVNEYGYFKFTSGTISNNLTDGFGGGLSSVGLSRNTATNSDILLDGGQITGNIAELDGGGVYAYNTVDLTISGSELTYNQSINNAGGAIYCAVSVVVKITGGEISYNNAHTNGGGVVLYGCSNSSSISGGDIHHNEAVDDGGAMAIYGSGSRKEVAITGSPNIYENTATNGGGISATKGAVVTMEGGSIASNTASNNGGGIYADKTAVVTVQTGTVKDDKNDDVTTYGRIESNCAKNGGGIYVTTGASLTVTDGFIVSNEATGTVAEGVTTGKAQNENLAGAGGGICVTNGVDGANSTFTLNGSNMAIYDNKADFSGDDVFSNGSGTKLTMPLVSQMDLAGYSLNPIGWFEDYNTDDTSYRYGTNMAKDTSGSHQSVRYREATIAQRKNMRIQTQYVTGTTPIVNGATCVNSNNAYVAMTLGIPAAVKDTVLIDYGVAVDIDLQDNDLFIDDTHFTIGNILMGIQKPDDVKMPLENVFIGNNKPESFASPLKADGQCYVTHNGNGKVTLDPESMVFSEETGFWYAVYVKNASGQGGAWYYAHVDVIPATTVYFEDNTSSIKYYTNEDVKYETLAEWKHEDKELENLKQGINLDADKIYGYDSSYASATTATYSSGGAHKVTVSDTTPARATFTFTGTGFDIISLCNSNTTSVMVNIYQGTGEDLVFEDDPTTPDYDVTPPLVTYFVDTWYQAGDTLYQVPVIKADLTKVQMSQWNLDKNDYDIWYKDYGYGTYTVELYVATTWLNPKSTDFYLDAIRIYNPAGLGGFENAVTNQEIQGIYDAAGEAWPVYTELRDMFLSAEGANNADPQEGAILFIDQVQDPDASVTGVNKKPTIDDYKNYGPNNEIYLAPGQAVAFHLDSDNYSALVKSVQIGMRSASGTVKVTVNDGTSNAFTIRTLSSTDMYYDLTKMIGKTVTISNNSSDENAVVSISNIKVTHTAEPPKNAGSGELNGGGSGVVPTVNSMFVMNRTYADIALEILTPEQLVDPVVTPKRPALSFNGMVCYNVFFTAEELGALTAEDLGLAVFDHYDAEGTVETAKDVIYGATKIGNEYMVATNGVHAKYLGDKQYFRAFAKKADGTYVYSKMVSYSALDYAKNALAKSDDVKLKQLVVAMLNYGAEAQKFFGYKTDDLMNATLTADDQALLAGFDATSLNAVGKVDASKVGAFASTGGFSKRSPAISFKGAFEINYFMTPANAVDGDMTLYFWNEDTYNAVGELTAQNADKAVTMTLENGTYSASSDEIAARYLDKTVYVAAVYESNGVRYCSGVLPYSIAAYCQKPPAGVQALATAAAIYGCTAKAYFGG